MTARMVPAPPDSLPPAPPRSRLVDLLDRYDGVLLDSFGVLTDGGGALPGAAALLAELRRRALPFLIVTNDASRQGATNAARFHRFGLDIAAESILSAGDLIAPHFASHGLAGARCLVLGTDDSRAFVADAGGVVLPVDPSGDYDAVVVCDDGGFPFLEGINAALSVLLRAFDQDRPVHRILPNPDLVFPAGGGTFGFTSGAIATLLEAALARRHPHRDTTFVRLGKPHRPIFDEARRRIGDGRLLMIGDQLETDIAGARAAGLDAALLVTGVTRWREGAVDPAAAPTYLLESLA